LWDNHWYSTDVVNTENSTNNWLSNNLTELSLIQVESFRPLVFLDMSDVDFGEMCRLERQRYGEKVVNAVLLRLGVGQFNFY